MNYVDYYLHYKKLFVGSGWWGQGVRAGSEVYNVETRGGEMGKRQEPRAWENIKMLDTDL
jgi:hypothetical protein